MGEPETASEKIEGMKIEQQKAKSQMDQQSHTKNYRKTKTHHSKVAPLVLIPKVQWTSCFLIPGRCTIRAFQRWRGGAPMDRRRAIR